MFRFENLDLWHRAVEFPAGPVHSGRNQKVTTFPKSARLAQISTVVSTDLVYSLSNKFPADERFGLTSQMRRAAVSISSNIAEGSGRVSDNEFARFIEIAYGSVMEVVSQAAIAHRQQLLSADDHVAVKERAEELSRMLSGLRSKIRSER